MRITAIFAGLLLLVLGGCARIHGTSTEDIELGWLDRSVFEKPTLHAFKEVYDSVQVSPDLVQLLREADSGLDMLVFLGTWCPDSRVQVPHFLKIIDLAGIPPARVKLYGIDRSKTSPEGLANQYAISRVPTFIFLKDGHEVGRITEMPQTTMETDMLSIFAAARSH